jgi:hypothetical protein
MKRFSVVAAFVCFIFAVLAFCPDKTAGQSVFGTITGQVTDPSGAVIGSAEVKVTNVNTGVVRTSTTNEVGIYIANSLPPGVYKVEAGAPGFKTGVVSGIALEVNANPRVNITLQVGESTQVIDVSAEAPLLNTQQSSLGQTYDQMTLSNLPIQSSDGRGFFELVKLSAGVSTQPGEGGYDGDNMRINGGRPRNDDYLLDGTSVQQPVWGGLSVSPSVDSVQEFRVETNSLSAEYGKVGGGLITAITKSGTNNFHGSVYEFLRNDALNAKDWFLQPGVKKLPFRYNNFGGTFGGPVIKNKLFFFADYEGVRSNTSTYSVGYLIPSPAFKGGDFSTLNTAIIDPATGQPFRNNQIPSSRISSVSQKMLAMWPDPPAGSLCSQGICNFSAPSPSRSRVDRQNARVDYSLTQSDHFFGVFHYQGGRTYFGGPFPDPLFQGAPAKALTVAWTHTFTPTLLNDFRFGWNKRNSSRAPYGYGTWGPADFGLTGFPDCTLPESNGKCGAPRLNIYGYTTIGGGKTMLWEPAGNLALTDTVSKVFGKHNLRFGGEARRYWIENIQPNQVNGEFTFLPNNTGNAFADFLLGSVDNGGTEIQTKYLSSKMWAHAYFIQDDWKVTPRLTLNLGLRYQIDFSWHEKNHLAASFNPYTLKWEIAGVNVPEGNLNTDYREFGPRVGFAWNPMGSFVVRGGYGIMYPGSIGHGRAGDGEPSPNLLAKSSFRNIQWDDPLTISLPDESAPLTLSQGANSTYTTRNQRQTYVQQWNLTLEKEVARQTVVQFSYVGSKGSRLPFNALSNICQASPEQVMQYGWGSYTMDSPYCAPGNGVLGNSGGIYVSPGYYLVSSSIYHAMTARVEKRFSNGFSLLSTFTWSKLIDDASSDWGGFGALDALPQDFNNRKAERSLSAGDVPLRLSIASVWQLPFGQGQRRLKEGFISHLLGGWQISGIYSAQKGGPVGAFDSCWGYCNPLRSYQIRPYMNGEPLPASFQQTLDHWFNTSVFDFSNSWGDTNVYPFGSSPRFLSNVRSPGLNNFDLSLAKSTKLPLGESGRLQFQADLFNAFNHAQFAPPGVSDDANFGKITATRLNMRTIQLGVHLYF